MSKIVGSANGGIDCKRMYIPGIKIYSKCPKCGKEHEMDMSSHYLSYPTIGKATLLYFYCEEDTDIKDEYCYTEWQIKVKLEISLTLVKEE